MRLRLPEATPLPWRRPRHELLTLALVAVAALAVVSPAGWEDISRMCLTRALVGGHLSATSCLSNIGDRSTYNGQYYSNAAPGLSILAVPAAVAVGLRVPADRAVDLRLWAVRLSTNGIGLLLLVFLIGRVCEGIAPGLGRAAAVTFALGTIASAATPSSFGHLTCAAFAFGSFLLAWSRRPFLAGLAAGGAILVEYQTGLIALAVGVYLLLSGRRAALRYLGGIVPGLILLGGYDWAAFGSPLHLSYRYDTLQPQSGLFGIDRPSLYGIEQVFVGNRGLLVDSPVLVMAAAGLVLLWRRGRQAEAALCSAVTLVFLLLDSGYVNDPYGGDSPGPRFVIPALPFLALGLASAFARWRRATAILAYLSVVASTAVLLTWPAAVNAPETYGSTVWRRLLSFAVGGSSSGFAHWLQKTVFGWAGVGLIGGAAVVFSAALTALAVSLRRDGSAELG